MKCKYCNKEYKTQKGLDTHIKKYCKNVSLPKDDIIEIIEEQEKASDEVIEILSEVVDSNRELEDELIKFYLGASLETVVLRNDRLNKFIFLYETYYNTKLIKRCNSGIVYAYRKLYYTVQKIINERNEN